VLPHTQTYTFSHCCKALACAPAHPDLHLLTLPHHHHAPTQEAGPDPEHMYNCHVIISGEGAIVAAYRKVHLFDVDVPNGPVLMESRSTAPGAQLVACDSPAGRLGLSVCYDLRFPELYQRLTYDMGAQLLLVPSAFTKVTGGWQMCIMEGRGSMQGLAVVQGRWRSAMCAGHLGSHAARAGCACFCCSSCCWAVAAACSVVASR
jgi:predicted amidohydrolase